MRKIFIDFLNLIFPKMCIVCNVRLLDMERHICLACLLKLPRTNNYKQEDNPLERFFAGRFPFVHIASFAYFTKGGSIQSLVHELKYKNNPELGVFLGELCGKELKDSLFIEGIDCIVPVPIHPKRRKERGYNQSLKIAEGISKHTHIPIDASNLVRTINNPSQTKQSRFLRWENVAGIFTLTDPTLFESKHILLLDDIVTTGSTLEACVKTLCLSDNIKLSIYTVGSAM